MKVYELPDDIFSDRKQLDSEIIFYHYSSFKDSFKEKSILKRNVFSLVFSGTKTIHFAEKTVNIQNSEIQLLSAGSCIASINIADNCPFESILIFFDDKIILDFHSKYSGLISNLKDKNSKDKSYIEFQNDEFLRHFIYSVLLTLKKGKQPSNAMKNLKVQELFLYLLENHTEKFLSFKPYPIIPDVELRIRKVVEANTENNLTLEELSFLCNISISTFKRHFKKLYNSSPIEWKNKQRMMLAGKMLATEKPGEIWYKLGFETHTGFTKSFKKHYGILPKDFANKSTFQE